MTQMKTLSMSILLLKIILETKDNTEDIIKTITKNNLKLKSKIISKLELGMNVKNDITNLEKYSSNYSLI